ncbi:MAG: S9 family peptidase [Alteromonadaceae bacterium]|nr:S9 family peptidase [Alteromonadaceae bacterium]
MKLKIIAAAISFSLVACASTTTALNTNNSENINTPPAKVATMPALHSNASEVITLEQIMANPDWMGRSPQAWYWGDDNETVFYQQKRVGNPLRDLYRLSTNGVSEKVALAKLHIAADRNAVDNSDHSKQVYLFKNNVFVKNLVSGNVQQLTNTSAAKSDVMFLTNGNVAYRIGDVFYAQDIKSNEIIELFNLKMTAKPQGFKAPETYIAKEQAKLINYIALNARNTKLREQQDQQLMTQNESLTHKAFYFGKGKQVVYASLSPTGKHLLVSISDAKPSRNDSDIIPKYIAKNGHIITAKVRSRVSDNRQYSEQLFMLDAQAGKKTALDYSVLPDFDKDVLASVKTENYQREGKKYTSKKQPRNIAVIESWDPIQWNAKGDTVAVMLEAWDNKDRWLSTVSVNTPKLINQHQLHDDAWINWNFNEYGWLNNSNSLYFLSEQRGYSQLYTKSLNGKVKQLTHGNFEISDVTLGNKAQKLFFKANKKHPGIYEIYQADVNTGKITALTNLGGMNDYALSPDNSKLLIQHSTITMPPELYVQATQKGATAKQLTHTVSKKFLSYPWVAPTVVAIASTHKQEHQNQPIYSKVYLPKNFDTKVDNTGQQTKNRAVMFSHGAGYLQNSHLGWSGYFREYMFHSMLVQQGYVVIDMDYRASAGYGRDWRTAIYRHMGKPEVEDMRDGVNWLVKNANVDRNRIGTYGGSYGGYLTLMSMFTAPDLFQSGSALRLVSDWAYYNHGYTSNILNTPKDDAIAYERSSPIYFAQGLEKPLLINAPMVDDNVFFQDTVRLVQRLIELEKQDFETAIYPVERHGFVQPSSWLNEYRRIYKLFENTL